MPGKNRFLSEEQATTISTFKQDGFSGGLNTDRPASELDGSELSKADNVQCFPKDIMGRSGSSLFRNRRLPGTGTIYSFAFHQSTKRWLLHQGTQLWKANATMSDFWEELLIIGSGASFGIDSASTITENRENFVISTTSGIFKVLIEDDSTPSLIFQANGAAPNIPLGGVALTTEEHIYHIVYTYVRMTGTTTDGRITPGAVMEQETGSVNIINASDTDYGVIHAANPISATNPVTVYISQTFTANSATEEITVLNSYQTGDAVVLSTTGTLPDPLAISTTYYVIEVSNTLMQLATTKDNAFAGTAINITDAGTGTHTIAVDIFNNALDHHTHIGIYMTNDLGSGIIDPETNTGHNPEAFVWIMDVDIDPEPASFVIDSDEAVWNARIASGGFALKTRQWKELPSGDVGEVAGGWFFNATTADTFVYYSQINDDSLKGISIGYYNVARQRHKLQTGIYAFIDIGDYLVIGAANKTYMYRLNSFQNVGTLQSVFQLTTPSRIDDTIGIIDKGTIAQISESRFIAVCSDASVRIFDTVRWGRDYSLDKVKNTEIKKMQVGSVAAYWQGAYYLWYRKASTDTHNINCLRLAVEDSAGEGWTTYSGDDWIKPPLTTGAVNFVDENDIQRIVVVDFTSLRPYWIETFDAYTGSGLTQTFIDKSDDPGICTLGDTYFYDALDDDSLDTGNWLADIVGTATIDEQNGRLEMALTLENTDEPRMIHLTAMDAGSDFEIEVQATEISTYVNSLTNKYELKLAPFLSAGDDIGIGDLAGDGIYLYGQVVDDGVGNLTHTYFWKAVQGATTYSSSFAASGFMETLRMVKVDDKIQWFNGTTELDSDTDSAWDSFPALKGSFAFVSTHTPQVFYGFNYFSFIAEGLANACIGLDGFGDDTVTGRSPSGTIKTPEIIGVREANRKEVQEAHAYIRPFEEADGLPSAFEINAKDYVDGSVTANETISNVPYSGDIEFFKEAAGRRLQAEFITNSTEFRLTAFDVDYVEKRERNIEHTITQTTEEGYQSDLTVDFVIWITRQVYTIERVSGLRATGYATIDELNGTTGPDTKPTSAVVYNNKSVSTYDLVFDHSSTFTAFTWTFWVKDARTAGQKIFEFEDVGGSEETYIAFDSATVIDFAGLGTVTLDNLNTDSAWHSIWIIRDGATVSVYQNAVLKGTITIGSGLIFGGDDFTTHLIDDENLVYDVRIYDTLKSVSELTSYNNDVLTNQGNIYLP